MLWVASGSNAGVFLWIFAIFFKNTFCYRASLWRLLLHYKGFVLLQWQTVNHLLIVFLTFMFSMWHIYEPIYMKNNFISIGMSSGTSFQTNSTCNLIFTPVLSNIHPNLNKNKITVAKSNLALETYYQLGLKIIRSGSRTAVTSKMERIVIIVNGFQPLTIITKHSIFDVATVLDLPLIMQWNWNELDKKVSSRVLHCQLVCVAYTIVPFFALAAKPQPSHNLQKWIYLLKNVLKQNKCPKE